MLRAPSDGPARDPAPLFWQMEVLVSLVFFLNLPGIRDQRLSVTGSPYDKHVIGERPAT